ncbi:MAG: hypothetical protein OXJ62_04075 [Spirochaetaceae bacterium]|nr:hypothetical protein [Spirochaetaceae bacterium]
MSDTHDWKGRAWRMVYGPKDLDTGTRKCLHAQRNPRLLHLPLPKAGTLVRAITKDGTDCCRETARSRRNDKGIINLIPVEFES